jgi:hypothetical protein
MVAPLKLFQEGLESSAPFGYFGWVDVAKGQVFFELFFLARKNPGYAGRHEGDSTESELVFLWRSDSHFNIVHGSASGQKERQDGRVFLFGGEEGVRETDLIAGWIAEALILSDEIVKVRRAVAPVAKNEDGWLNGDAFEERFETALASSPEAVFDALSRDGNGTQPERGVDGKSFAESGPLLKGDAGEHPGTDEAEKRMAPVMGRRFPRSRETLLFLF